VVLAAATLALATLELAAATLEPVTVGVVAGDSLMGVGAWPGWRTVQNDLEDL
jgi:hypothetical protein